jgi:predicted Zn finger-like uncharacterized protein
MQIVCPQCVASYLVADAAMGDGRMVRCTDCGHIWLATPEEAAATAAAIAQPAAPAEAASIGATGPAAAAGSAGFGAAASAADHLNAAPGESTDFLAAAGESGKDDAAVAEAPPLVPDVDVAASAEPEGEAEGATIDADPGDDEAFVRQRAARREREAQRRRMRRPSWSTVILTLMVIIAGILAFRVQVVRAMPQTASLFAEIGLPVNLRGLVFHQVAVEKAQTDGVEVLIVKGEVVNVTRRLIEVPRLRFSLRDAAGAEVYHWTALPGQSMLGPGDVLLFRTRLASPPPQGQDIVIRFFNRNDR